MKPEASSISVKMVKVSMDAYRKPLQMCLTLTCKEETPNEVGIYSLSSE